MSSRNVVLASSSPIRSQILSQLCIKFEAIPTNINVKIFKGEKPNKYAQRSSLEKADSLLQLVRKNSYIISADTVVALGLRILPKATSDEMVKNYIKLISGKRHRIYTGLCVLLKDDNGACKKKELHS